MSSSSTSSTVVSQSQQLLKVALCQLKVTHDKESNLSRAQEYIEKAAAAGCKLIVLPEMFQTPYSTKYFNEYSEIAPNLGNPFDTPGLTSKMLSHAARENNIYIIGGSFAEKKNNSDKCLNTTLAYDPNGKLISKYSKMNLFKIDIPGGIKFDESETLDPGTSQSTFTTEFGTIGLGICFDIRFPLFSYNLRKQGANLLIFPGAFNMTTGPLHWELLMRARALDNQSWLLACSPARVDPPAVKGDYVAYGHSMVVSPSGIVVDSLQDEPGLLISEIDLNLTSEIRKQIPVSPGIN